MADEEGFYEKFAKSIAPSIFGNEGESFEDVCERARTTRTELMDGFPPQKSRKPSPVSSSEDPRRSFRTECDFEEISTFSC